MYKYFKIAKQSALSAGKILKDNFLKQKKIEYKGRIDIVTNVDREAEQEIMRIIHKHFPEHNILTEETKTTIDKNIEYCWVIDPLDGTTNYAHRFPFVAVSVGLQIKGESVIGIVYNPILDELFWGIKGEGSFVGNKKICVSQTNKLSKAFLATGFPYDVAVSKENNLDHFARMTMKCMAIRRAGSAALDLCYLANGVFDGFWELKLHPWDTAAAMVIVQEAGGKITKFDGTEFNIFDKKIIASNGIIHQQMLSVLNEK